MAKTFGTLVLAAVSLAVAGCSGGDTTRDTVRAVGSSTVLPFAKKVAEDFARENPFPSPIVESTGTGGGMQLFCSGVGSEFPDIANASRRMKPSEFAECQRNGVDAITEIQVGLDGIAFASAIGGITIELTPRIVYEALAANPYGEEQTAERWSDVDPSLPDLPILVYGPPPSSGTRDALAELILTVGCEEDERMAALKESDEEAFDRTCTEIRGDSAYVTQGEQDNVIINKITGNSDAIGIFGYSYLAENDGRVQGLSMNGVAPTYANIASGSYPGARPLLIYVKNAHLDAIPGLREFVMQWTQMWAEDGPLAQIGLVANRGDQMEASTTRASEFTPLTAADLQ